MFVLFWELSTGVLFSLHLPFNMPFQTNGFWSVSRLSITECVLPHRIWKALSTDFFLRKSLLDFWKTTWVHFPEKVKRGRYIYIERERERERERENSISPADSVFSHYHQRLHKLSDKEEITYYVDHRFFTVIRFSVRRPSISHGLHRPAYPAGNTKHELQSNWATTRAALWTTSISSSWSRHTMHSHREFKNLLCS